MVKLKHLNDTDSGFSFLTVGYDWENLVQTVHTKSTSVYMDTESSWSLVVAGSNLKYKGDIVIGGKIDKVSFIDGDGENIAQITDLKLDALKFPDPVRTDGIHAMYAALMKGNDVITGSAQHDWLVGGNGKDKINGGAGNDEIEGGHGNDTLTGSAGGDIFIFGQNSGADVVTDFVATGSGHDWIGFYDGSALPQITQKGDDTLLTLSDGSTMLLKGVSAGDLTAQDSFIGGYELTI